ncbi:MAG: 30S ribosomal protein S27ae [Candidatus Brockarchaeota archaeon]|nr:30S ribosomal protein S27ae [Candidatus Brockarchaeota archaeon]
MKDLIKYYEVDVSKKTVKLRNRKCPRCGKVMAFHKEVKPRWHCGSCDYTEFVR